MPQKTKFQPNAINQGNGLDLLQSLPENSAKLVFFDPQYEKVKQVLKRDYPLCFQSDSQISQFCQAIARVLKPSGFYLLWVNKAVLSTARVLNWLAQAPQLKIVDFLVWYKQNTLGMGSSEFAFLVQKLPISKKAGEHFTNRAFGNVLAENTCLLGKETIRIRSPKDWLRL